MEFPPRDTDLNEETNGTKVKKNKKNNHSLEEKIDVTRVIIVSIDPLL